MVGCALVAAVVAGCSGATTGLPTRLGADPVDAMAARLEAAASAVQQVERSGLQEVRRTAQAARNLEAEMSRQAGAARAEVIRAGQEAAQRQAAATVAVQGAAGQVLDELQRTRADVARDIRAEKDALVGEVGGMFAQRQADLEDQWRRHMDTAAALGQTAVDLQQLAQDMQGRSWLERIVAVVLLVVTGGGSYAAGRRRSPQPG